MVDIDKVPRITPVSQNASHSLLQPYLPLFTAFSTFHSIQQITGCALGMTAIAATATMFVFATVVAWLVYCCVWAT